MLHQYMEVYCYQCHSDQRADCHFVDIANQSSSISNIDQSRVTRGCRVQSTRLYCEAATRKRGRNIHKIIKVEFIEIIDSTNVDHWSTKTGNADWCTTQIFIYSMSYSMWYWTRRCYFSTKLKLQGENPPVRNHRIVQTFCQSYIRWPHVMFPVFHIL